MSEELPDSEAGRVPPGSTRHPDDTLGGYFALHNRPPAFQGSDGAPYTVSMEVEKTPHLPAPFSGYLVFPRWAESGVGIVGHLETPILLQEVTREGAEMGLGALPLPQVKSLLEDAIRRESQETD